MSAETTSIAALIYSTVSAVVPGLDISVKATKEFGPRLGKACFSVTARTSCGIKLGTYHITTVPQGGASVMPTSFKVGCGDGIFDHKAGNKKIIKRINKLDTKLYNLACKVILLKRYYGHGN